MVEKAFNSSERQEAYEYVFDLTGEVRTERLEEVHLWPDDYDSVFTTFKIHIEHTFNISRLCAAEAAKRKVKAYVRLQQPCYDCSEKSMSISIWFMYLFTISSGNREEKDQYASFTMSKPLELMF